MTFEELQKTWQSQQNSFKLTIDSDLLLKEVKRNHRHFELDILKRDIKEVWSGILASLFCVYLGIQLNFWVIFVMVPFGIYISLVLVIDRKIQKGKQVKPSKSLDSYVQASLSQLDHQIWLVKNVFLWYLLPLSLSLVCLVSGALWEAARGGCTVLWVWAFLGGLPVFFVFVIIAIYRVNQKGVREELLPRRQELEQLLTSIQNSDE